MTWWERPLLHALCVSQDVRAINCLLAHHEVDVDRREFTLLRTALHESTLSLHVEVVTTLLRHCADANARDVLGMSPLHMLCRSAMIEYKPSHRAITEALVSYGADMWQRCCHGLHAVDVSLMAPDARMFEALHSCGMDLHAALRLALRSDHAPCISYALQFINPNTLRIGDDTALEYATRHGCTPGTIRLVMQMKSKWANTR